MSLAGAPPVPSLTRCARHGQAARAFVNRDRAMSRIERVSYRSGFVKRPRFGGVWFTVEDGKVVIAAPDA